MKILFLTVPTTVSIGIATDVAGGTICIDGDRKPDDVFGSTSVGPSPDDGTVGVRNKLGALAADSFGTSFI